MFVGADSDKDVADAEQIVDKALYLSVAEWAIARGGQNFMNILVNTGVTLAGGKLIKDNMN